MRSNFADTIAAREWGFARNENRMHGIKLAAAAAAIFAGVSSPIYAVGKPSFIKGKILVTPYDGESDDLLTGGFGKTGLQAALPAASPNPTAAEPRRRAIHTNYRA